METKTLNLEDIDRSAKYEGYLWLSDSTKPLILDGDMLDTQALNSINPFVIEGQLYDRASDKSISIRNIDGKMHVCEYSLDGNDRKEFSQRIYYGNRMDDKQLCFMDIWRAEKDPRCMDMEVLQPEALVFIGFKKAE